METIEHEDLARLARLARLDRRHFYEGRPEYRGRFIGAALCQGAGQHCVDVALGNQPRNGVKDFDVWSFFADVPGQAFPAVRRNVHVDFGTSKFGRWEDELERFSHFQGRRVDLFLRGLLVPRSVDPIDSVRAWLAEQRTVSAELLSQKGAVMIAPRAVRGVVAWPLRLDLLQPRSS